MNDTITVIAVLVILAGLVLAVLYIGKRLNRYKAIWKALDGWGIPKSVSMFKYNFITPKGVRVISTVTVPDTALNDIDAGIESQIIRHNAAFPHWNNFKKHTDYQVLFVDQMDEHPTHGTPEVRIQGIQSAGTCIGVNPMGNNVEPMIVLPHQQKQEWKFRDYLMRSAWNESEHCREFVNSLEIFLKYAVANDVHPHVPGEEQMRGLVATEQPKFTCGLVIDKSEVNL